MALPENAAYGEVLISCWDLRVTQPPGSQPALEVPDDHHTPVRFACSHPTFIFDRERLALAGFPAAYRGLTREAYTLDRRCSTITPDRRSAWPHPNGQADRHSAQSWQKERRSVVTRMIANHRYVSSVSVPGGPNSGSISGCPALAPGRLVPRTCRDSAAGGG